jgi:hypothetical protein
MKLAAPFAALLALLAGATGHAAPDPAGERVTLELRAVPLRAALSRLYDGSGQKIRVDAAIPDRPVTGRMEGVPRAAALRSLLQWSGVPRLVARIEEGTLVVRQQAVASVSPSGSITTSVSPTFGRTVGFSVGPGGTQVPNTQFNSIQAIRRTPNGVPVQLGEIGSGAMRGSSNRAPLVPGQSVRTGRSSGSTSTFVTVTILPEPGEEKPRKKSR